MSPRALAIAAVGIGLLLAAQRAAAAAHPTRTGETGFVEVPSADVVGVPGALLGAELRFDRVEGATDHFGPFPLYGVAGVSERIEVGFSIRQWGAPGDELPQTTTTGLAAKLKLVSGTGPIPSIAIDSTFDQLNSRPIAGSRLIFSNALSEHVRLGAFAGAEIGIGHGSGVGATFGGALAISPTQRTEAILEALSGPRGTNVGAALRWVIGPTSTLQLGFNYLPDDEGLRASLGVSFAPRRAKKKDLVAPPEGAPPVVVESAPVFTDPRPRFRLRIPTVGAEQLASRQRQHGPYVAGSGGPPSSASRVPDAPGAKPTAPSLNDLATAQLRDQEALADAREKRVRAAGEQLDAREAAAATETSRLATRERELKALEAQIAAREERTVVRTPSQQQRQLETIAAQLASQERNLAAQEKSYVPALDAAEARERAAALREQEESGEAARLASAVVPGMSGAAQAELRKQALAARSRKLAAMETRLLARGERIDATERQLGARRERVEAWMQRLNTRLERLQLLEKLLEPARTPPPAAPSPAEEKGAAAPPKDKPAFVMVVKAPTTIVKGAPEGKSGPSGAASPAVSGEKAVIAATVVMFPTATTQLSELDRETLDNIARMAAKESGELLIWARAKDPSLVAEAERRATEIRTRAAAAGPLDPTRINTRVTMRPGAAGVDVVVSALREAARPRPEPTADTGGAPRLEAGESGKRQLRDAVQAAQPSIEACIGEHLQRRSLQRAEGTLKVTVSPQGQVRTITAGGDLAGDEVEGCLRAASASWQFPATDAEYAVDLPITVVGQGGRR